MSWPVAKAATVPENAGAGHGLGIKTGIKTSHAVFDSLNSGVRTLIAGKGKGEQHETRHSLSGLYIPRAHR